MQKWIIKNEVAVSNLYSKDAIRDVRKKGIRAVISFSKKELPKEWIPPDMECRHFVMKEKTPHLSDLKEFLLYTNFLKRIKFPFVIFSDDLNKVTLLSAMYLMYNGKTATDAVNAASKKAESHLTAKQLNFIHDVSLHIELFHLNERVTKFYETDLLIHLLRKQCPWDREQTHLSLIPELIEEPLELVEAIKKSSFDGIIEELGDVMLQILLHSAIGEEENKFSINNVMDGIFTKMYRRHPHVFGNNKLSESKEVLKQWEKIKRTEKKDHPVDIAKVLAGLITAFDVQEEAGKEGFDFASVDQVEQKVKEEMQELKDQIKKGDDPSEELGDLIFSVINLSRFLNIDPAHALFISMEKFRKRFEKVKRKTNNNIKNFSAEELDKIWEQVKSEERGK